ncbi:MAG: Hpt domain-containing protein [Evtepia gabavorous]
MRQAWDEGRWEDYVIEVHSLKSAARWIGAMDLGDQAEALEMAGRSEDLETIASDTPCSPVPVPGPERNLVLL